MDKMLGGEVMARMLANEGVDTVFGIIDGTYFGFYSALRKHGLTLISPRHEASAAPMAGASPRVHGKTGICQAHKRHRGDHPSGRTGPQKQDVHSQCREGGDQQPDIDASLSGALRPVHTVTFGVSWANSFSPMPLTSPSSSTLEKRP